MKKIISLILVLVILVSLVGCVELENERELNNTKTNTSMFVKIETFSEWIVVYHKETKVMYAVSWGYYNCGTFTVLLNPDGTPMLWDGEY